MNVSRFLALAAVLALIGLMGFLIWRPAGTVESAAAEPAASDGASRDSFPASARDVVTLHPVIALNRAGQTIHDDLRLVQDLFLSWQTNFPVVGNPVGTNAEITAALCGENALNLDLLPRDHPAINAQGELCDRWGTPFRFHQQSGTEMEIISAGPDGNFATADDVRVP